MSSAKPVFWCDECKMEAYSYKTISPSMDMVQCFACNARSVYNTETQVLTPYNKNKGRKNEFNIIIKHFTTDDGRILPSTGS